MRCVVAVILLALAAGSLLLPAAESSAQELVTPPELNFPDFPPLAPETVIRSRKATNVSRPGAKVIRFPNQNKNERGAVPHAASLNKSSGPQVADLKVGDQDERQIEPPILSLDSSPPREPRLASSHSLTADLKLIPSTANEPPLFGNTSASVSQLRVETDVPQLRVTTVGPDTLVVGRSAEYRVTVTNYGDFTSNGILVRSSLPHSVQLKDHRSTSGSASVDGSNLEWMVDQVTAGSSEQLTLDVTPLSGEPFDLNVDVAVQPQQSRSQVMVQAPELRVQIEGREDVSYGMSNKWQVNVSNPGTGDVENVRLDLFARERSLGSEVLGTIAAGDRRTLELTLTAEEVGLYSLTAEAHGDVGLTHQASTEFVVRRGEISLDLLGTEMEYAGASTTYEVVVRNSGDDVVEKALLTLSFPVGMQYEQGLAAPKLSEGSLSWVVDRIDCGQEFRFPIKMKILDGGLHHLNVTAAAESCLATPDSITTEALTSADLKLEVIDPTGPRPLGAGEDYVIHVINQGTDFARDIRVVAVCAPEVEPVDVSGNAVVRAGQIFFKPIVELGPDHKVTFKVRVQAVKPGAHAFRVVLKCHEPKLRLASEESTRFFERGMSTRSRTALSHAIDTDQESASRADQLNR